MEGRSKMLEKETQVKGMGRLNEVNCRRRKLCERKGYFDYLNIPLIITCNNTKQGALLKFVCYKSY